jgi:hypothetical protein
LAAMGLGLLAVVLGATACALQFSLPYRIGYHQYPRYLWSHRCAGGSVALSCGAILLGCAARRFRLPIILALIAFVLSMNLGVGFMRSGPMPQWWCHNRLQRVGWVKDSLANTRSLSAGAVVTEEDITAEMRKDGSPFTCAEGGKYTYNPIGVEPRCSIHGSVSEMEAAWKAQMKAQHSVGGDGKPAPQP